MDALFRAGLVLSLVDRITRPLAEAQRQLSATEERARMLSERLSKIGQGMGNVGRQTAMVGGAMTAAFAAPVKMAGDFQESMADVNKVADFSRQEYEAFAAALLDMSERIPMAAGELAQLAAAGAQMGIPKTELAEYTEMVSQLAVAFDMPAGEIGDTMGKLANVFDLPMEKVGLLGDAVNLLSNNMAASAPDIVNALSRVGGVAADIGLTAEQTSALSASLVAMGEQPERAGTAMGLMLIRLSQINTQSKDAQEAFEELGFSAEGFAERMREDPLPAIMEFFERANETGKASEYLSRTLGMEVGARVVKLANNMDMLRNALDMTGDEATYAGSAYEEFMVRSSTFFGQLKLFWNTVKRVGITLGTVLLPPLTAMAKALAAAVSPLAKFAEEHKVLSGIIFGVVGALGAFTLVAGGVLIVLGFMATGLSQILSLYASGVFSNMLGPLRALRSGLIRATSAVWGFITAQTRAVAASSIWSMNMRTLAATIGNRVWSSIRRAVTVVWSLNAALLANPITWIAAAMAAAAFLIYKYWDHVKAFFTGFFNGFMEGLEPMMPALRRLWNAVAALVSPLGDLISWVGGLLAPAEAAQGQLSLMADAGRALGYAISWLFSPITGLIMLVDALADVEWGMIFNRWAEAVWSGLERIGGLITDAAAFWSDALANGFDLMIGIVRRFNPLAVITRALTAVTDWLSGFSLFEAGQGIISSLWDGMKSLASKPVEMIKDVAQKVRDFMPFSPARTGPLADIDKTGFALMETMARGIRPGPVSERMQAALTAAKRAVPTAALSASLAVTPAAAAMPELGDLSARAQYVAEAPLPPQLPEAAGLARYMATLEDLPWVPDLTATAMWHPELAGTPELGDLSARISGIVGRFTVEDFPEITRPDRRMRGPETNQIQITVHNNREINVGAGGAGEIERILDEDGRELEERLYDAVVRALDRRRRGDFGG